MRPAKFGPLCFRNVVTSSVDYIYCAPLGLITRQRTVTRKTRWTRPEKGRLKCVSSNLEVSYLFSTLEFFCHLGAAGRPRARSPPPPPSPPSSLDTSAAETTVGTDRLRAHGSAGRAAVPPRAVLRREGLSRFHKCPVRRRGSRLGWKMRSWVQLLLVVLAACLWFGVAEVSLRQSQLNTLCTNATHFILFLL